jgi:hypothetical protein
MTDNTEMNVDTKSNDIIALLATAGALALEEFIKHPIGGIAAIFGLLYMFDRWRTQRIIKKRYTLKLKEDERLARISKERTEGSED